MSNKRFGSSKTRRIRMPMSTIKFVNVVDDSDIPDEILVEILLRLPLEAIFKFKAESKRWLSLISHPSFATSFRKTSSFPAWYLLYQYGRHGSRRNRIPAKHMRLHVALEQRPDFSSPIFSLEFLARQRDQHPKSFSTKQWPRYRQTDYYVCNPLKQWVSHPKPLQSTANGCSLDSVAAAANMDLTNWCELLVSGLNLDVLHVEIFSLDFVKDGYESVLSSACLYASERLFAVLSNGIMHWLAFYPRTIIAYDPSKNPDQCRLIDLPRGSGISQ
ncbi:unnamed protein product [Dovyalis caffra]|uniref:F-box domain-containing protein n=1 Tax=Dovyalis caffra TaxID=77055 RepID=A0AAV1R8H9_9ROSI|nr:unnamed protein product [Dovyalis caffra]